MAELTVEEKKDVVAEICRKFPSCFHCAFRSACREVSPVTPPRWMSDRQIEELYRHVKLKGEPIMNEHETQTALEATTDGTIVITRSEYAYLIAKSVKIDLLEDYVNNRNYLDKEVVHAILGMFGSEESEGE